MEEGQFPNDGGVERVEIEADPRHAQILVAAVNLCGLPLPLVDVELTSLAPLHGDAPGIRGARPARTAVCSKGAGT